jgi:hypothetical protein
MPPATRSGLLVAVLLAACGGTGRGSVWGEHGAPGWSYDVRISEELDEAHVRTCFAEEPRGWLAPADPAGRGLLRHAEIAGRGGTRAARTTAQGIALDGLAPGECVVTVVELDAVGRGWEGMLRRRGVRVVSPLAWLWAPSPRRADGRIDLHLRLPPGVTASVPWEPLGAGHYRLDATALRWRSFAAFGRFTLERVELPGGVLEVAQLGGFLVASPAGVRLWLTGAGRAAASLLGELPTRRIQVIVLPTDGGGREPVFFGATARGGGEGVILLPNAEADDDTLVTDWVAPHELSHFALPVLPDDDAWMSEGFITYYTEVLRARVGLRSDVAAWKTLANGCARGRRSDSGRPLAEESAAMHEDHSYQRAYWGGAALALYADVEIRRASRGRASLDAALRELSRCCRASDRAMPAQDLLRRVSIASGGVVLRRVADAVLGRATLPPIDETLARLGVRPTPDGSVELDAHAPDAWIREAITAPPDARQRHDLRPGL